MAEQGGLHKIQGLRRRWVVYHVLEDVLLAVYAALYIGAIVYYLLSPSILWGLITFPVALIILLMISRPWQMSGQKIAAFLNKEYPELQESSHLLLLPAAELNPLQVIASSKTEAVLNNLKISHKLFAKRLVVAFVSLIIATAFIWALGKIFHIERVFYGPNRPVAECAPTPALAEKVLPQISSVNVSITPPAYTGKGKREQDKFNLSAEEAAVVEWHIKTNVAIKKAYLLFNDKEHVALTGSNGSTNWHAVKAITNPGFYQVSIDGKVSDLYYVQVVKDNPPVIHIKTPKQYTYIDAGEAPKVTINATLNDDYGIGNAVIIATVAKGKGEGVKFKEYRLNFAQGFSAHNSEYDLQKLIRLPDLNVEPGDEFYFYVQAQDTHKQVSRTDVYTVSVQDTAELLSMNGIINGVNLKPEFFRSERQIIIDAEQLLKEKDSISVEKFNNRSNNLGIDQKLLRLRYGKFLGEEGEDAIGAPNNDPADPADFSNATKILKEYTDDHDNAEDAGFFEPAIKAQLKATLTEMWKAELQLRLYKPQAALPFAYKALRLLKDLQQKSRAFVAKTAYNPPPFKQEKRLSGELDKIIQPINKQDIKPTADQLDALKKAVSVLEDLKTNLKLSAADNRILQLANQQLNSKASAQPGVYLPALNSMRRILSASQVNSKDVDLVERALQKTLTTLKNMPASNANSADMGLSKQYYKNLKQANR
jgi:regulator of replication initiation timing